LRSISEHLFRGFVEKQTRYSKYRFAEPEKALLDWVYLTLQSGLTPRLDEIELQSLVKQKLVKYANKYPGTVSKALTNSLAFEHFAALNEFAKPIITRQCRAHESFMKIQFGRLSLRREEGKSPACEECTAIWIKCVFRQ
jgi:hypothetical protein